MTLEKPDQANAAEEAPDDGGATHVNGGDPVDEPTEGTGDVPDGDDEDQADADDGADPE